ncbi:unnamed protein product [Discosporangium mesarthrocarpum]
MGGRGPGGVREESMGSTQGWEGLPASGSVSSIKWTPTSQAELVDMGRRGGKREPHQSPPGQMACSWQGNRSHSPSSPPSSVYKERMGMARVRVEGWGDSKVGICRRGGTSSGNNAVSGKNCDTCAASGEVRDSTQGGEGSDDLCVRLPSIRSIKNLSGPEPTQNSPSSSNTLPSIFNRPPLRGIGATPHHRSANMGGGGTVGPGPGPGSRMGKALHTPPQEAGVKPSAWGKTPPAAAPIYMGARGMESRCQGGNEPGFYPLPPLSPRELYASASLEPTHSLPPQSQGGQEERRGGRETLERALQGRLVDGEHSKSGQAGDGGGYEPHWMEGQRGAGLEPGPGPGGAHAPVLRGGACFPPRFPMGVSSPYSYPRAHGHGGWYHGMHAMSSQAGRGEGALGEGS